MTLALNGLRRLNTTFLPLSTLHLVYLISPSVYEAPICVRNIYMCTYIYICRYILCVYICIYKSVYICIYKSIRLTCCEATRVIVTQSHYKLFHFRGICLAWPPFSSLSRGAQSMPRETSLFCSFFRPEVLCLDCFCLPENLCLEYLSDGVDNKSQTQPLQVAKEGQGS